MRNFLLETKRVTVPAPSAFSRTVTASHTLLGYVRPMRARWYAGLLVSIGVVLVELMIPQVLSLIVDSIVGGSPTASTIWWGGLVVVGIAFTQVALVTLRRWLLVDSSSTIEQQMRLNIVDKLLRQPISFHDRWPSGQLLQRSMGDLNTLRQWTAFGLVQLISVGVMLVVGIVLLLRGSVVLTAIYAVSVPLIVMVIWRFVNEYRELTRTSQEMAGDLATTVEESVHGIRVLKALGRGEYALRGFDIQSAELRELEITRARALGSLMMRNTLITGVTSLVTLGVGIYLIAHDQLSVGQLTAFFATTAILNAQIERFGGLMGMGLSAKVSMERHRTIVDSPDLEDIRLTPKNSSQDAHRPAYKADKGAALSFEGVSFAYSSESPKVLDHFSLDVAPGEIVALVGSTGSGKSTVLQLVPRLYEADRGAVYLDGQPIAEMPLETLRETVSFAFEEPVLFSDTVRENVLLGVDRSTVTAEELEARLAQALEISASDFVADLPDGVDSVIGEEGMSLSGGQRQRLSLARAIATRPRILLLDDPLSALDVNTEKYVVEQLKSQLQGTTILLTAHRPSTVVLADRVALIVDGKLLIAGTPADLQDHPNYRALLASNIAEQEG